MTPNNRPASAVQSVQRAIAIMRCFTESEPELGVTEISQRLGLHKSTVSRIVNTLQHEGLVSQNANNGKYRLGVGLISLAGVALGQVPVRSVAYDLLDQLALETRENVAILVVDGQECVNVYSQASPRATRYANWIGRRFPLHCTASGKVLLAGLTSEERDDLFTFPLHAYTDNTAVERSALEREVAATQLKGYAFAIEEYELGFNAVSVPIINHASQVIAALGLSGPSFRLDRAELESMVAPLARTAAAISAKLGFVDPQIMLGG